MPKLKIQIGGGHPSFPNNTIRFSKTAQSGSRLKFEAKFNNKVRRLPDKDDFDYIYDVLHENKYSGAGQNTILNGGSGFPRGAFRAYESNGIDFVTPPDTSHVIQNYRSTISAPFAFDYYNTHGSGNVVLNPIVDDLLTFMDHNPIKGPSFAIYLIESTNTSTTVSHHCGRIPRLFLPSVVIGYFLYPIGQDVMVNFCMRKNGVRQRDHGYALGRGDNGSNNVLFEKDRWHYVEAYAQAYQGYTNSYYFRGTVGAKCYMALPYVGEATGMKYTEVDGPIY